MIKSFSANLSESRTIASIKNSIEKFGVIVYNMYYFMFKKCYLYKVQAHLEFIFHKIIILRLCVIIIAFVLFLLCQKLYFTILEKRFIQFYVFVAQFLIIPTKNVV